MTLLLIDEHTAITIPDGETINLHDLVTRLATKPELLALICGIDRQVSDWGFTLELCAYADQERADFRAQVGQLPARSTKEEDQPWQLMANPVSLQAFARGEPVPVNESAMILRARGYEIPSQIPDDACVLTDPASPTGYAWKQPVTIITVRGLVEVDLGHAVAQPVWPIDNAAAGLAAMAAMRAIPDAAFIAATDAAVAKQQACITAGTQDGSFGFQTSEEEPEAAAEGSRLDVLAEVESDTSGNPGTLNPLQETVGYIRNCRVCGKRMLVQLWESNDGGHEDSKYTCPDGHVEWVDGIDS